MHVADRFMPTIRRHHLPSNLNLPRSVPAGVRRLVRLSLATILLVMTAALLALPAAAQPVFSKSGMGTFTNVNTPILLNDATGRFQTQGNVLCQAPQTGQLTSPAGVCMQYTPSVPFIGGASAIFGLKGALTDYTSPALTTSVDTPPGSTTITVLNNAALANVSVTSSVNSAQTLSALASTVSGALPVSETISSMTSGSLTSVLQLSSPTLADLPPGSTLTFTTNTSAQQFTALAASVDLTAHQAPGTAGQAWAANFIVQAEPGSNGAIHGIEIDAANFSTNVGGFGVWLGNNGSQNMNAGFLVGNGVSGKGWLYGLESTSAVTDDVMSISSANTFNDDRGTHSIGAIYQGTYSSAILQGVNPRGLTASQQALFTITPKGGIVDSSINPVGAANGSAQVAVNGTTGIVLVCSGTLATQSIAMPTAPLPKQIFHIASECNVTTLTLTTAAATSVVGAASGITPSTPMTFMFDNDRLIWLRW